MNLRSTYVGVFGLFGFFFLWAGINLHTYTQAIAYTQANEPNTLNRATCANIRLFAFHYSKFYIWDSILAEINNCWTNIYCFFLRNVMCDIECALKIQISGLADIIASNCFVLCLGFFLFNIIYTLPCVVYVFNYQISITPLGPIRRLFSQTNNNNKLKLWIYVIDTNYLYHIFVLNVGMTDWLTEWCLWQLFNELYNNLFGLNRN